MRYLCVHCGNRFEHGNEGELRCPKCMRATGLEKVGDGDARAGRPAWVLPAAIGGLLLVVGVGYAVWAATSADAVGDVVPERPLREGELRGHLRRLGVEEQIGDLASLLAPSDALEDFAEDAVKGTSGPVARARAVVEAIRGRASAGGFVRWSRSSPRETPVLDAAAAFERMAEDGAGARLYPLEVTAVAVAALRSVDVPAMVAEVFAFPGDRVPADPSGKLGYYGVAVWDGEPGKGAPTVLDPFEGHGEAPAPDDVAVKTDVMAVGAAANHRAVHEMVREGDTSKAYALSRAALTLDPTSPTLRSAHAAVVLVSGGGESARGELEAAAQMRDDAPRRNDLAGLALAEGDVDGAARQVGAALEAYPDYPAALGTLAAVHLAQGENELARGELARAEQLDPELHNLPLLWANYYLATRQEGLAAEKALEAVEARPLEWQRRIQAAQVLRAAGRYDEMRRQARTALDQVPAGQKEAIRTLIERALGPTALEPPMDELAEADGAGDEALALPDPDQAFRLGEGSSLLGGDGAPSLEGPSLLGDDAAGGGGGPLLKLGDPSKLKLREPGTSLRLDGLGEE